MTVPLWSAALTPKGTSMAKFYTLQWISEGVVIFSLSPPPTSPPFPSLFPPQAPKEKYEAREMQF